MNLALAPDEMQTVRRTLAWLRAQAESDSCMLCDSAGNVIDREGKGPWAIDLVSALAAGVYGASRELARVLGQEEFDSVLNQGEKTNIFFQSVTDDLLLVTVFSETASTGLVKLYAARAAEVLRQALVAAAEDEKALADSMPPLILKAETDMFSVGAGKTHEAGLQAERRAVGQV